MWGFQGSVLQPWGSAVWQKQPLLSLPSLPDVGEDGDSRLGLPGAVWLTAMTAACCPPLPHLPLGTSIFAMEEQDADVPGADAPSKPFSAPMRGCSFLQPTSELAHRDWQGWDHVCSTQVLGEEHVSCTPQISRVLARSVPWLSWELPQDGSAIQSR